MVVVGSERILLDSLSGYWSWAENDTNVVGPNPSFSLGRDPTTPVRRVSLVADEDEAAEALPWPEREGKRRDGNDCKLRRDSSI